MTEPAQTLTIRRPDDWHLHLRDDAMMKAVLPFSARWCGRAVVMPNLSPPVTTASLAGGYENRILAALPVGSEFTPLMTCYLTDDADPDEIERGHREGAFFAVKLYPANATTNSAHGVTSIERVHGVFERMERIGMPLLVHGEVMDSDVDVFDREAAFIDRVLVPLLRDFPGLRLVFEHVTTEEAVQFVEDAGPNVAATITPHHLMINRNALFDGGFRPHMYCLPLAKRERHRLALRRAATSGEPRFFLGTDSAPHPVGAKHSDCGCAGIFNAPTALACYAQVFEEEGALDRLEAFASLNGPGFHGLAANETSVTLQRDASEAPWEIVVPDGEGPVRAFRGAETLSWTMAD